ncbi:MAG: hypothetical protein CML05_18405 [Pseudozobellia sp.]|nr:hypothetical protein [Pseudozobellia sp.]|tara:strand:+ start:3146 stop:3838 length:693 start_codon:yes stop_codon:yes gene_type:complete
MTNHILSGFTGKFTWVFLVLLILSCSKSEVEEHLQEVFGEEVITSDEDENLQDDNDSDNDDSSDNNDSNSENLGVITAKVNGTDFHTPEMEGFRFGSLDRQDQLYYLAIGGFDISGGFADAKYIYLYLIGDDFDELKAGKSWNTTITDLTAEGAWGAYIEDANSENEDDAEVAIALDDTQEIAVHITAFDFETQLISGEFSFTGTDEDSNNNYQITDGKFTNISLKYQNN